MESPDTRDQEPRDDEDVDDRDSTGLALRKDFLVLAMLATLAGETRESNERDLFLACWHAYPNVMRWVDTALPNPETFAAALRRLDAAGYIVRVGKQRRNKRGQRKSPTRSKRGALDPGRSGVVRAKVAPGALQRAGIDATAIAKAGQLVPSPDTYQATDPARLIVACVAARSSMGRSSDEGALVETAFHKFPAVFSYRWRPEFPDTGAVRDAIVAAQSAGWLTDQLTLSDAGRIVAKTEIGSAMRIDKSEGPKVGALKAASRIESTVGYREFVATGSLSSTKADELFRLLRVPPTTDPRPLADALKKRSDELRRVDRPELAHYLLLLAGRYNTEARSLIGEATTDEGTRE